MDETLGELIVKISTDLSKLQQGLNEASNRIENFSQNNQTKTDSIQKQWSGMVEHVGEGLEHFGRSLTTMGRSLSQLSGIFTLAGATGMAPFVLALHDAEKSIPSVGRAISNMTDVGQKFYETLAVSILPVIKRFTEQLNGLLQWFLALPQGMRDTIAQQIFMNSTMLVGIGIITKISAEIFKFAGDIFKLSGEVIKLLTPLLTLNPLLLAFIGIVAVIITALGGWNEALKVLVNTLEVLWNVINIGVHGAALAFIGLAQIVVDTELAIAKALMNIPGINKKVVQDSIQWWDQLRGKLQDMAHTQIPAIGTAFQKIGNIITTGTGEWNTKLGSFLKLVDSGLVAFKNGSDKVTASTKTWRQSLDETRNALPQLISAMQAYSSESGAMAKAAAVLAIGLAIVNTAVGVTDRLANKEGFPWPVPLVLAGIVGAAGALEIGTIASQGFAEGTDTVPSMLSPGEMVIPSTFADAIRKGNLTLGGPGGAQSSGIGGGGNVAITINMDAVIKSDMDIQTIAKEIAFQTNRELRYIRRRQQ